jgi:endonuclease/exonuclease/phosphatase family metal-dependent hydrolase
MATRNLVQPNFQEKRRKNLPFFFWLNLLAVLLLLGSQLSASIHPGQLWLLEVLAASYPVLLFISILFLIWWGVRKHRFVFLSAAAILIGYEHFNRLYQPGIFASKEVREPETIRFMSYNVRLFDLYNWTGNLKTRDSIFKVLIAEAPDVLCLQEYFHSDKGNFQNNDTLKKMLALPFSSIRYGITLRETDHWGLATFSRFPIIDVGTVFYTEGKTNFCLFSDLKIGTDTLRVYNLHFQSNHFKPGDYEFIENVNEEDQEGLLKGSKNILRRIRKAVKIRAEQADELAVHIKASPYPAVVCGDFNDPPFSYAYQTVRGNMKDAWCEEGSGFGSTYIGLPIRLRIDYIFHSPKLETVWFKTIKNRLSDHYPIQAGIRLR